MSAIQRFHRIIFCFVQTQFLLNPAQCEWCISSKRRSEVIDINPLHVSLSFTFKWGKVFKNGTSKIYGIQPCNTVIWSLKINFTWFILEYFDSNMFKGYIENVKKANFDKDSVGKRFFDQRYFCLIIVRNKKQYCCSNSSPRILQ